MLSQFHRLARIRFLRTVVSFLLMITSNAIFAGEQVPYKGSAAGVITEQIPTGTGDPMAPFGAPFLIVKAKAVGRFTHVGKATITFTYNVRLERIDGEAYLLALGTYILTAANGSTITGTFMNKQLFGSEDFTAEVVVTGGTRAFTKAFGELSAVGKLFLDGSFYYDLDGTISGPKNQAVGHQ